MKKVMEANEVLNCLRSFVREVLVPRPETWQAYAVEVHDCAIAGPDGYLEHTNQPKVSWMVWWEVLDPPMETVTLSVGLDLRPIPVKHPHRGPDRLAKELSRLYRKWLKTRRALTGDGAAGG